MEELTVQRVRDQDKTTERPARLRLQRGLGLVSPVLITRFGEVLLVQVNA